jgi:hypothetical protein
MRTPPAALVSGHCVLTGEQEVAVEQQNGAYESAWILSTAFSGLVQLVVDREAARNHGLVAPSFTIVNPLNQK